MNFAFCVFKYYPFGGLERNFFRILEEVLSRGHFVTIFTMKWEGAFPDCAVEKNFKLKLISTKGFTNHSRCFAFYNQIKDEIQPKNYDLIVGFNKMPGLDLYYCADVCFKYETEKNKSFWFKLTQRYKVYSEFEDAVFSNSSNTKILALSHIQKDIYMREYDTHESRFFPIPPGIDKKKIRDIINLGRRKEFRQAFSVNKDEYMLLMIGSDFKRKGVVRSLEAISVLPDEIREKTKLFVLGRGKEGYVMNRAISLGIENCIFLQGGVDNVPEYLAAADLLLHPALAENTGNAIVEALIAGLPVIATDNCGYAFHVLDADAGWVVPGNDFIQQKLNDALLQLLTLDAKDRSVLGENALLYSDSVDFYSRPTVVADIIESLINQNK